MTARISFVAHPDDDLLFLNPDIASDVQHASAIPSWTVYLTAGNIVTGPSGEPYADQRINGLRAAYARAAKAPNSWSFQLLTLPSGRQLATNYLLAAPHVHLVWLYINGAHQNDADGDLRRMWLDPAFVAQPIDNRPSYTRSSFIATLKLLIAHVNPQFIRLTDPYGQQIGDHVDHAFAGKFAAAANLDGTGKVLREMHSYFGYAARNFTANNSGYWETEKRAIFDAYRPYDSQLQPTSWSEMPTRQHRRHVWSPGDTWLDL